MISQAYADRSADFLLGVAAQTEAIRERRQFCWLKDRPYNPFLDHTPQKAPVMPRRGPSPCHCDRGILYGDDGPFRCSCPLGDMDDQERNEIWAAQLMMAAEEN